MTGTQLDFEALIGDCFQAPEDVDTLTRFDAAFRPYLLAVLRRDSPDPSLTMDVYQAAFMKFLELFKGGQRPRTNYAAYLVAVAKHCLIDELRRQRRYAPISDICAEALLQTPPDEMQRTEVRVLVHQAMKRLDRRCQFILESYYLMGMPVSDLARHLGIQLDSVHMTLKRCRTQLGTILSSDVRNGSAGTSFL